ncbi:MAG: TetR/AcrR family transcriptional regulator [Dehalococcoidia bacterium]|nr:TetR/AcrR family transcriptional regulator [Dehalococcoidia bacterium]
MITDAPELMTSRGPGRLERRKARTRAAILDAAARLFQERGYDGTSIQHIAEAADTGVGTVYGYFASKDEMLREVLRTHSEQAVQRYRAAITGGTPAIDRVLMAFDVTAQFIREHRAVLLALVQTESRGRPEGEHPMSWLNQQFTVLIAQGIERGELRPVPVDATARLLVSTCSMAMLGIGAWAGREDDPDLPGELCQVIRAMLTGG